MAKNRILVIDDDFDIRSLIADVLSSEGYEVLTAADGQRGLEIAEKTSVDLIILDINMPKMGGIAFYRHMENPYDGTPKVPILVLTGRDSLEDMFKDLKIEGFMTKPFKMSGLLKTVQDVFKKIVDRRSASVLQAPEKLIPNEASAATPQKAKKILLAEEDDNSFNQLRGSLQNAGYGVDHAKLLSEVFSAAQSQRPNLILMKLATTNLLGPEMMLVARLHRTAETASLPLMLYISKDINLDERTSVKICSGSGVVGVVQHSNFSEVLPSVDKYFSGRPLPKPAA